MENCGKQNKVPPKMLTFLITTAYESYLRWRKGLCSGEIILDYPGGPSVISRLRKSETGMQKRCQNEVIRQNLDLLSKIEEGGLLNWKRRGNRFSLPPEGMQPFKDLDFSPVILISDF